MKKLFAILLCLLLCLSGCKVVKPSETSKADTTVKYGIICLHDQQSTYDKNFIDAFEAACKAKGVEYLIKTNVPETNECYEACADLVDHGCNIVFADSFGHEDYLIKAAQDFPDVQFCHATGTKAHTEKLDNFHNAFAAIYEGRYLAGVVAGLKLQEMGEEDGLIGYIGAYTYAEVISGYTSYFLGVRSVCPDVEMEVIFTGSWYDQTLEAEAATKLISDGCVLISQHADSMGAPAACEDNNVPNVSYNGSTLAQCPNTFLISSRIDWQPYFELTIDSVKEDKAIPTDYTGTIATGSVKLTDVNENLVAKGTKEILDQVYNELKENKLNVFSTSSFTVDNEHLTSYKADVDSDANYEHETEVIVDGVFLESVYRSAPYFDLNIDGIKLLNNAY